MVNKLNYNVDGEGGIKEKVFTTLLVIALFVLTIFVFGVIQVYFNNVNEFPFLFGEISSYLFIGSFCVIILMTIIILPLNSKIYQKTISIIFAISFLLWIQGNFFVWNYGLLDGKSIQWDKYTLRGILDSTIWVLFILFALIKSKFLFKYVKRASLILLLIQLIATITIVYQAPQPTETLKYYIDNSNEFSFSKDKNVIIMVLDTFETDVFKEITDEDKSYSNVFDGFTYYQNSLGGYPVTYPSLTLMLTGKYYDNSIPVQQFIKNQFKSNSLPLTLKENGFEVDLHTAAPTIIYADDKIASNYKKGLVHREAIYDIASVADITLFRYSPHFIKKAIYNNQNWFLKRIFRSDSLKTSQSLYSEAEIKSYDSVFFDRMKSETDIGVGSNTFKFYHLMGLHQPLRHNEKFKYEELTFNRQNYKRAAEGTLVKVKEFLNELKNKGIYNNSLIFIIGDHGAGFSGLNVNTGTNYKDGTGSNVSPSIIASAIPLILVKPIGSSGEMKTSEAPVSLSDIPETVISELNIKGEFSGKSMFKIKDTDLRERRFMYFDNRQVNGYLSPFTEYRVNGFSWDGGSWLPFWKSEYKYGSVIKFGRDGDALKYQSYGWDNKPVDAYTWNDGNKASLMLPIAKAKTDMSLKLFLKPFLYSGLKGQIVDIYINGDKIGKWIVTSENEYKITIPKKYLQDSVVKIEFNFPEARSPKDLKLVDDSRIISIAVKSLILEKN